MRKLSDEEVYEAYVKMCRTWRTPAATFEDWLKVNNGITPFVSEKFQLVESRNASKRKVWG
jgi:hypothetical protein